VVRPLPWFCADLRGGVGKTRQHRFRQGEHEVEQELAGYFQIRSIPTLMVFREQVILYSEAGSLPAHALDGLIEQVMGLDMAQVHKDIAEQQAQNQA